MLVDLLVSHHAEVWLHRDTPGQISRYDPSHAVTRTGFWTKQSRGELTRTLTATWPDRASRSGTCGARFPRETDPGVRLETPRGKHLKFAVSDVPGLGG